MKNKKESLTNASNSQFDNVYKLSNFEGLDIAENFLQENFEEDRRAIEWINKTIVGSPIMLEANGDSYSKYQRVSSLTGLPTVMGWYVHEWLWRNNTSEQNMRANDIKTIYTSKDKDKVEELIKRYNISYIYIRTLECQKFPELNHKLLQEIGKIVFSDGVNTYIMKVN